MWPNPQETADLVTFTGEILSGKLYFLCSASIVTMRRVAIMYFQLGVAKKFMQKF